MRLLKKQNSTTDELRRAVLAALVSALEDAQDSKPKSKSGGLTGVRALATGAALYGAGRAIVGGRRLLQERSADGQEPEEPEAREDEDELYDEPESGSEAEADEYDEEYDEPQSESDEDYEEPESDEPESESDEDYEEPESDEPESESDEDYEEPEADEEPEEPQAEAEEEEPEERPAPRRRRRRPHGSAPDQPSLDLPKRPSRSRSPIRT